MITITIYPLKGIEIEGVGTIDLGKSRLEVEATLGKPNSDYSDEKRSTYLHYECRIDYDDANAVSFIEFFSGPFPERIELRIYGIDPFNIGADNLVALMREKNDGLVDGGDGGFSYTFLNISVGIWRDAREEDVQEWVEEKKANGEYDIDREWVEEELASSRNFWTIGIGVPGYYTAPEEL